MTTTRTAALSGLYTPDSFPDACPSSSGKQARSVGCLALKQDHLHRIKDRVAKSEYLGDTIKVHSLESCRT